MPWRPCCRKLFGYRRQDRGRRYLGLVVTGFLVLGALAPAIRAHASLLDAVPAPGSTLRAAPTVARLTFDTALVSARITILTADLRPVSGIAPARLTADGTGATASLPALGTGTYTMQWSVQSVDGHDSQGSYAFAISPATSGWVGPLVGGFAVLLASRLIWSRRPRRPTTASE